MNKPRDYDSTVARMAGNIAAGCHEGHDWSDGDDAYLRLAIHCVKIARAIVAETKRTEPKESGGPVIGGEAP